MNFRPFLKFKEYKSTGGCKTDKQGTQGLNDTKEYQDISKATSGEFAYDVNGNMIKDLDRDIYTIKYNVLNLPDVIQFKNGNQIKNLYDASR